MRWSNLVSIPMTVLLPLSLSAQDAAGAMLYSNDPGVFVDERAVHTPIAISPNEVIKTEKVIAVHLKITGSDAEIKSETIVQFNPTELALDHGSVDVVTSRGLRVRVGCITVMPVHDDQLTHYQVLDVSGKVTVAALKEDVFMEVHAKSLQETNARERERNRSLVRQGEQSSREEQCGAVDSKSGVAARGPLLNSPYAIGTAAVGVGVLACLGLLCHNDDPVSPAKP